MAREDFLITTMREICEIFVMSVSRTEAFHSELMNPYYTHMGLALSFDHTLGTAKMKVLFGVQATMIMSNKNN